ncbi:membrane-targeted effector domain-containing toxin [Pseudomonas tolaasii]
MTITANVQQPSAYSPPLIPVTVPSSAQQKPATPAPSLPDGRQTLKAALGDRSNLENLAQALTTLLANLPENAEAQTVATMLQQNQMSIARESTFMPMSTLKPATVSLEAFIKHQGITMPHFVADVKALASGLREDTWVHPLGNFAGALAWPIPLDIKIQHEVFNVVACNSANLEGLPLSNVQWGALDYLADGHSLSKPEFQDPAKAMEKLLDSPRAQALGEAIQLKVDGIATDRSVNDYVLAAVHLGLDPESIDAAKRNQVAGFDLAALTHFGKRPAEVVRALAAHLITTGKTSKGTAELGARLLLARVAPQFLITDIPAGVSIGSQAWANLCLAVAGIEGETPGKTARMSFSAVMQAGEDVPAVSEANQKAILIDWAVANQVIDKSADDIYPADEVENARDAFNKQLNDLKAASSKLEAPLPNRKAMALALLKKRFGDDIDFERKVLRIHYGAEIKGPRFSDPYSLLDITMQGLTVWDSWQIHGNYSIDIQQIIAFTRSAEFNVPEAFDKAFSEVTGNYKSIKQDLMMNAITHLPLEDRTALNYGELRFFKENSYRRSLIPFTADSLFHSSMTILVQTEHEGKTRSYAFDTVKGFISKTLSPPSNRQPEYISNEVTRVEEFSPPAEAYSLKDNSTRYRRPNLFQTPRIRDVAATVVKGLGIDDDSIRRQAEGRTWSEKRTDALNSIGNFLLDLIPLRSAIVNLNNGNYKDAATDLAFDIFGFVTAGLGMAGKLTKVAGKTGSTISKAAQGSRIIGATAFSAFNPLGGLGDITVGAGKLALQGTHAVASGVQQLRSMASGVDLAQASTRFEAAATGALKVGDQTVTGSAVKHNNKWYAFDAGSQQPYGPPLGNFDPVDTLMPPPHKMHTHTPQRVQPYPVRPPHPHVGATKLPLPAGDYVDNTLGKLVPGHFIPGNGMDQTKAHFTQQMENYHNTVKAGGVLPATPTLPPLPKQMPPGDLITEALKVSQGVVFGESHSQMASFKLLMANMQTFKAQGVKKVYFEGVIDLPPFGAVDDGISSLGSTKNVRTNPTFKELRDEFRKNGIDVMPLDHYYLTRHKDERPFRARTVQGINSEIRLKEFNYFAAETIQANSGTEKWIALVGNAHMNTSEDVTGLAELTGTLGIGVFDNANVPATVGFKDTRHVPDPKLPLKRGDLPGNLHIYMKP